MKNILAIAFVSSFYFLGCDQQGDRVNNQRSTERASAELFRIIATGSIDDFKTALQKKADPNVQDEHGVTPLMMAAKNLKGDFFRELVHYGAKIDLRNKDGLTALDMLDKRSIDEISRRLKALEVISNKTAKEKTEYAQLTQLSIIKRYGAIANYVVPNVFEVVPNLGAGSCFFYSITPFLQEIFVGQHNNFAQPDDVRNFLATYFTTQQGVNFANIWIPNMRAADPERYDRPGKTVITPADLVELITNTGKFATETFWGDELTDGLVKTLANIVIIKIKVRQFGSGQEIFYCQGDVDKRYVAFMKYHPDAHYEAMKLVEPGKAEKFTFDMNAIIPNAAQDMINAYTLQCKQ